MMKTSLFYDLEYDKSKSLISVIWNPNTEEMTEDDFQNSLLDILKVVEKEQPKFYLANTQNFLFTIVPDVQDWTNKHFFPQAVKAGLQKMAVVMSEDIFAQVSIEQLFSDDDSGLKSGCFPNAKDALEWLK